MEIIDGKQISLAYLEKIKKEITQLNFAPVFCDILVGNDKASIQYVNLKKKKALELGILFHDAFFPESIGTDELLLEIEKINNIPNMCGVIVQLPLPTHIDTRKILDAISPKLDVDALGETVSQNFYAGNEDMVPPTALSVLALLDSLQINLNDKNIVILGEGKLVGKPVAQLLKNRNLNFKILNSHTENNEEIIKSADIIISGIGKGKYLIGDMVKDGVIIIDAGTSEEGGSIVGDIDFESVQYKASHITPVPGGVGPMTVAMLFSNVLKVAKKMQNE